MPQLAAIFIALAFDVLIFGLTLKKTLHHTIEMKHLGQIQRLTPGTNKITTVSLIISPFFDVLPNLLISRLVLNLSNFYSMEEANLSNNRTISGLQFATNRILGNIGAPLHISVEEPEECSASDELENFDLDWS
ncbi:hypothetical protein D9757_009840 [Collybiopsis confluens]|uniref:Uncharacterized protein n=1 Tax=Collybiopsis confluens TaxID=2823264 RepID=A0A8H5H751_9AGAR|nr:hypothetical protein D9757_009840 [Collybiopsis confluens]